MIASDVELQILTRGLDPLDVLLVAVVQDEPSLLYQLTARRKSALVALQPKHIRAPSKRILRPQLRTDLAMRCIGVPVHRRSRGDPIAREIRERQQKPVSRAKQHNQHSRRRGLGLCVPPSHPKF